MNPAVWWQDFKRGIFARNPVLVLVLGLCPALAVTTSVKNSVGMGLSVIAVVTCSNLVVSMLRRFIPNQVRIPCFIVVIATFVTLVEIFLKAQLPALGRSLGIYVPLIVVNCAILERVESFGSRHGIVRSLFDGLGAGVGFSIAIIAVGAVREVLGMGTFWGYPWLPQSLPIEFVEAPIMIQGPGAFLVLGLLMALVNKWRED